MSTFLVGGSQPALSLAEAQAIFPDAHLQMIGGALLTKADLTAQACVARLGGIVKAGRVLLDLPIVGQEAGNTLAQAVAELIRTHPRARKIVFSLTVFGSHVGVDTKKLPLEVKRHLKDDGPVRWFADPEGQVTPAAVKKAGLIDEGFDVCVLIDGKTAFIGFTEAVQDPDAWTLRDMGRPWRDAENGMLPPKLARLLVNLAGPRTDRTLLDPFCGSGTIPMEAALLGYTTITGSDLDPRQVKDTEGNMRWLADRGLITYDALKGLRFVVSAASYIHTRVSGPIDTIVTEGYLGAPLKGRESLETLKKEAANIEHIWNEALPTFAKLQPAGGVLVGIWPILTSPAGKVAIDATSAAQQAGYMMTSAPGLIYARPDQFVQRRIVVLHKQ